VNVAAVAGAAVRRVGGVTNDRARQVLGQGEENDLQDVVDLLRSVCEVDVAALGVLDGATMHYLVTAGAEPRAVPLELSLCRHAMGVPGLLVVSDIDELEDGRHVSPADGPIASMRFYASAPVHAPGGEMVGRLCLFDTRSRDLAPVHRQALATLADGVGRILRLRLDRFDESGSGPTRPDLELVASISHDLRMPLAALNASLELLDDTIDKTSNSTADLLVTSARRSVDRMSGLVDGLMRLHDLTKEPLRSTVDLNAVARRARADLRPLIEEAGAVVRADELPTVTADPDLMYSVFLNLVSNAVKFARPDVAPLVRLHGRRVDGGWRISVTDNGTGVPGPQREAVFEMFTRLTDAPGHGIGLTTVARIVRAHGGSAGVEDADGPGSEFWFELPDA
jgi:two-component sensor histidine kinase